jgi:hypothetical protein
VTSYTFTNVTAAHRIRAVYAINMYTLSVSALEGGTVVANPVRATYAHGTAVTVTALADTGWAFSFWSGSAAGSANPLGITMTSDKAITATFVRDSSYQIAFRSFSPESIAVDRDNKGAYGKIVKRKPDKVDFRFNLTVPNDSVALSLRFTAATSGAVLRGPDTLFRWTNLKAVTGNVKAATASQIQVSGIAYAGRPVKTQFDWSTLPTHTRGTVLSYLQNQPRLPMPNRVNVLFEAFEQGGFDATHGLLVGRDRSIDSARNYGWLAAQSYTDVVRTLYYAKSATQHKGTPRGLGTFIDGSPIVKRQKSIPPVKHNNALLAEMVAVKAAITASAMEKIPLGFGELVYNDGTSNPLNGMMVKQIAALADSVMMGRYEFNVHVFADSSVFANLYATLDTINDAFEGPIDTVDFAAALHLKGVRTLASVPYLRAGTVPPSRIIPRNVPLFEAPVAYRLEQNYPNPFNPTTTISFELPMRSVVTLKVYNMLGQEVATLLDNQELDDGAQELLFDASSLATGAYFYRITAEGVSDAEDGVQGEYFVSVKKMMLIK